jgi:hypothetical protein
MMSLDARRKRDRMKAGGRPEGASRRLRYRLDPDGSDEADGWKSASSCQMLDLGNAVAEYDDALERYFVETATFEALIGDRADVIAGDKGTGKTALYRILQRRYRDIEELDSVEVLAAFNPTGNPVFHRLTEGDPLDEGQYTSLWKAYVLALAGNWLLEVFSDAWTETLYELDDLLRRVGLRSPDDSPATVFSQIVNLFRRLMNPKATEVVVTPRPDGLPIVAARVEFEKPDSGPAEVQFVSHDEALTLLDRALDELDVTLWLVLDRLDEAFAGFPLAEIPALRALLRTYLDLNAFPRVRLKLFVRKDLFRRIIGRGFVNLTHINARKVEIVWDEDDLFALLVRRISENEEFIRELDLNDHAPAAVFNAVFPTQVDAGDRKPTTWNWVMSRIADGNGVKPPRNLIDLMQKGQEEQRRREQRAPTNYEPGRPIIGSEALKKGLARLSSERVEDTLLAEAGDYAYLIEKFRSAKAEHNDQTLAKTLDIPVKEVPEKTRILTEIGFLERVGSNYKVPMLYRYGLGITQGKAFVVVGEAMKDEDEEEDGLDE